MLLSEHPLIQGHRARHAMQGKSDGDVNNDDGDNVGNDDDGGSGKLEMLSMHCYVNDSNLI